MLFIIEFISIFLISLSSYYFYDIGIAPFPFIGLFLLLLFKRLKFNLNILVFSLFLVIYSIVIPLINGEILKFVSAFAFLLSIFAIFLNFDAKRLKKVLGLFILIHSFAIFLQVYTFFIFNYQLDFLVNITGEIQRTGTGNFIFLGKQLFRPTGFFSEPSTYAVHILPIILLYFKITKKINLIGAFGIISVFLTFSAVLVVMLAIFILFLLISNNINNLIYLYKKNKFIIITLLTPLFIIIPSLIGYFINSLPGKMFSNSFSNDPKRGDLFIYLFNNPSKLFFGIGFTPTLSNGFNNFIVNDNGLLIYLMLRFGFFGAILLFILLYKIKDNYCKGVFIILWVSKLSPTYPMLFLIYAISLNIIRYEKNKNF